MNVNKKQIYDLLYEHPVEVGHWVGFKDLTDIHNEWLWHFLYDDEDQTLQGHRAHIKRLLFHCSLQSISLRNRMRLYYSLERPIPM